MFSLMRASIICAIMNYTFCKNIPTYIILMWNCLANTVIEGSVFNLLTPRLYIWFPEKVFAVEMVYNGQVAKTKL